MLQNEYHKLIEDNISYVKKVINANVHGAYRNNFFTYDDLVQIGNVGLCKAAKSFKPDGEAGFKTYAYSAIRNEIFNALEYATVRKKRMASDDIEVVFNTTESNDIYFEAAGDAEMLLNEIKKKASGVTAKGIDALILMSKGYSCKDIGEIHGVSDNNISAWILKARKFLLKEPAVLALRGEI